MARRLARPHGAAGCSAAEAESLLMDSAFPANPSIAEPAKQEATARVVSREVQTQPCRLRSHHSRVSRAVKISRNGQLSQTLYSVGLTYSV